MAVFWFVRIYFYVQGGSKSSQAPETAGAEARRRVGKRDGGHHRGAGRARQGGERNATVAVTCSFRLTLEPNSSSDTVACSHGFMNIGVFAENLVGLGFLWSVSYQVYINKVPTHEKRFAVGKSDLNDVFNLSILGLGHSMSWLADRRADF